MNMIFLSRMTQLLLVSLINIYAMYKWSLKLAEWGEQCSAVYEGQLMTTSQQPPNLMVGNQQKKLKTDFTYWRSSMQKVRHRYTHSPDGIS